MTRAQLEAFAADIATAAAANGLDRNAFTTLMAEPNCAHALHDLLNGNAGAVPAFMAAADAFNKDGMRAGSTVPLFTEA